jgi:hypothetical protein
MRSVYRNVKENRSSIGLYPFEPLHDMRRTLERMRQHLQNQTQSELQGEIVRRGRDDIIACWNGLRHRFLAEFAAPSSRKSVTRRGYRDPRRLVLETDAESIGAPLRRYTVIPTRGNHPGDQ